MDPHPRPVPDRVSFFVTCLVDQFYPEVGESAVNVLERLGVKVDFPAEQTCCGQPAYNTGFARDARDVAERFLDVFDGAQPIVTPSGSCAATVRKLYPEMFRDDRAMRQRARRVGRRVFEFSEFIVDVLGRTDLSGTLNASAAYHRCCHLLRELGVDRQPLALLAGIRGLELRAMDKSEVCCGFGGTFAVKFPAISTAMLEEKLDNSLATGADMIVMGDAGCLMHMQGGLRRRGETVEALHLAQVLDRAMAAADAPLERRS